MEQLLVCISLKEKHAYEETVYHTAFPIRTITRIRH